MHAEIRPSRLQDSDNEPGKAGPRTEIQPESRIWRKFGELGRIGEVPGPQTRQGGGPHQILGFLPKGQEIGVAGQPVDCFTWNFKGFGEIFRPLDPSGPLLGGHGAASSSGGPRSRALFHMRQEQHEGGGRHAIQSRGLAEARRPLPFELLAKLG